MRRWVILALVLVACGGGGATMSFGAADDGTTAAVGVGDRLEIALPANPSTGFAWEVVVFDGSVLRQEGDPGFAASADLPGASGTTVFTFTVIGSGATTLDLVYRRPWESDPPSDTFAITVVAD